MDKKILAMKQIFTMDVEKDIDAAVDFAQLLAKHKLRGEFYICGYIVEEYPEKCRQIAKHHAVGGHGYYHENFAKLPYNEQKQIILKTRDVFAKHGMNMEGWRFPRLDFTNKSLNILAKLGIYDSSFNRRVWKRWGKLVFIRNWLSNIKRGQFFLPTLISTNLIEKPWDHVDLQDKYFYKKEGRLMMHCYEYRKYNQSLLLLTGHF